MIFAFIAGGILGWIVRDVQLIRMRRIRVELKPRGWRQRYIGGL